MRFAIVDIETTGGKAYYHRVIEIAAFVVEDMEVARTFHTLINPGRPIPGFITSLTGIDESMVADAPAFEDIASDLMEVLEGAVFVAHNVNFDLGFIRNEFKRINLEYNPRKLCTVRLSRKLFKGLPSYSLGNLCRSLRIQIKDRHRAHGDAGATVDLFKKILLADQSGVVAQSLKANSKEASMPPHLDKAVYDALPEKDGVYYFLDRHSEVLYVGKARNIKKRISEHFSTDSKTRSIRGLWENIYSVSYELCGNELVSLIFETHEIKRLWPPYNQSLKNRRFSHGLFLYEDRNGYYRLALHPLKGKTIKPVRFFSSLNEGKIMLSELIKAQNLCAALCGLSKPGTPCFESVLGNCQGACMEEESCESYNERVLTALESNAGDDNMIILGKGRSENEQSIVWLEEGRFNGFGYVSLEIEAIDPEGVKDFIKPLKYYPEYSSIIRGFVDRKPMGYQFITI